MGRLTFKQFLLSTTPRAQMPGSQLRELQAQLQAVALAWDGVAKAMKDARAKVNG